MLVFVVPEVCKSCLSIRLFQCAARQATLRRFFMLALAEYFNVAWVLIGGVVVFGAIQIWRLRDGVTYGIIIAVAIYNFQIRIVILACLRR